MRRFFVASLVVLGAVAFACGDGDHVFPRGPVTRARPPTGPGLIGEPEAPPRPAPVECGNRPKCGLPGAWGETDCCPQGWRCIDSACVAPGIPCTSNADCSDDRFCALELQEPRCYPARPATKATCSATPDVSVLGSNRDDCGPLDVHVQNLGGKSVPAGTAIRVDAFLLGGPAPTDRDASHETETLVTSDAILPGELVLIRSSSASDYRFHLEVSVVRDVDAAVDDCVSENDTVSPPAYCYPE
jgi:hypothetical protein